MRKALMVLVAVVCLVGASGCGGCGCHNSCSSVNETAARTQG
jgi:hypothetical protein